ncbi:MAG TPA: prepilin peptidase [Candidatus Paceibacterota bacterium]|nr:prepilin peptidase [Candidatus Paceibacterota bacterium]HRZ34693.1 prepilin peptidase [Candidatus Paceibacterota bacterium]
MTFGPIFSFLFGTIIGSFLNVVIFRYNTGHSINGRSGCLSCGQTLSARDLIPILSWLFLRGRCRKCGSRISIQYPLVEFFTGLLFVALFWMSSEFIGSPVAAASYFVWHAIIFATLIIIFVYDLKHKIIPDGLSYFFAGLTLIQALITNPIYPTHTTISILNLLSGPILFLPFFALWLISSGRWIGLGDGKLALGIGWYLGFISGLSAVVLAFWIGAVFAVIFMLTERLRLGRKNITMKTEIPFAPFLIIGTIIEFFLRIDVIGIGIFF